LHSFESPVKEFQSGLPRAVTLYGFREFILMVAGLTSDSSPENPGANLTGRSLLILLLYFKTVAADERNAVCTY